LIVLKTGSNSQLLIPPKKMPELVSELDSTTSYRNGIFPLPRSRRRRVFENIQYEASFENIPYRGLWLVVIAVLPIPYSPSPPLPATHMGEAQFVWFQAPHNLLSFADDCFVCPGNTLELLLFYTWVWGKARGCDVVYLVHNLT
jgi:hypothetical protein